VGVFAAFLLGATVGVVVMAAERGGRKAALPFGPFMIAGCSWLSSPQAPLVGWYGDLLS